MASDRRAAQPARPRVLRSGAEDRGEVGIPSSLIRFTQHAGSYNPGVRVFSVEVRVAKPGRRPRWKAFRRVLVDGGSEMTWLPESELRAVGVEVFKWDQLFVMANGQYVTRNVGTAVIECGESKTVDEVVLGQAGDLALLEARTLEGFNAVIDARKRKLIPAGPMPAA